MKTNCKKWRYASYIMVAALGFTTVSVNAEAADAHKTIATEKTRSEQNTTLNKMNSKVNIVEDTNAYVFGQTDSLIAFSKNITGSDAVLRKKNEGKGTLVMAKVNQSVNMRKDADQDTEKVGVLYKDCGGEIVERKGDWTKVASGDVVGWVKNDYLYFGEEAKEVAKDVGMLTAYSATQTLRVRKDADLNAGVLGLLANGEAVEAIEEQGDWVSVNYEGTTGYVSAKYVKVVFDIDKAESMASIKAREEAERARAAAEAEAKRKVQKEAVLATASEVDILAALIQCEAGGEPYEGQVAVGAVVMNRVRSGGYPNTITDVIYASGQFVPASKGKMESLILNGNIKPSCVQAANEVINGACNVGEALHFRRNNGRDGLVIGNHVFY